MDRTQKKKKWPQNLTLWSGHLLEDAAVVGTVQLLHLELQHLVAPTLVAINYMELWLQSHTMRGRWPRLGRRLWWGPLTGSPYWPKPTVTRRRLLRWLSQGQKIVHEWVNTIHIGTITCMFDPTVITELHCRENFWTDSDVPSSVMKIYVPPL